MINKSRIPGFSIDEGLPSTGTRYGGDDTIHNTGTIDIQLDEHGQVKMVWFRCKNLAYRVSTLGGTELYSGDGARLVAVETL